MAGSIPIWKTTAVPVLVLLMAAAAGLAQSLPNTAGETLTGKPIVLADAVRGHAVVLVAGFSRESGDESSAWGKALRADPAMADVAVYEVVLLDRAPGFMRGVIKSGIRKGVPPVEQDHFVILVQDEKLWRSYFGVDGDKDAYVVLLDAAGQSRWHGHGAPGNLEPLLRAAKP